MSTAQVMSDVWIFRNKPNVMKTRSWISIGKAGRTAYGANRLACRARALPRSINHGCADMVVFGSLRSANGGRLLRLYSHLIWWSCRRVAPSVLTATTALVYGHIRYTHHLAKESGHVPTKWINPSPSSCGWRNKRLILDPFVQRTSLDIAATPMPARILGFRAVSSTDVVYVWRMNAITVWIACATARSAIEIGGTR